MLALALFLIDIGQDAGKLLVAVGRFGVEHPPPHSDWGISKSRSRRTARR